MRGRARVDPNEKRTLVRLVSRAMMAAGVGDAQLAISLTDDAELRRLNARYAAEDHATDVLSFSQQEGAGPPETRRLVLGDIVISVPTARRQARSGARPLADELVHLAVHGLAHLLGFDHATVDDERVMFGYEDRLRAAARSRGVVKRVSASRRRKA